MKVYSVVLLCFLVAYCFPGIDEASNYESRLECKMNAVV